MAKPKKVKAAKVKQAKSTKTKTPKNGKPKSGNGAKGGTVKHAHVQHACSILDPFCPAARAAKRPDVMGNTSIGFCVRGSSVITTDATGAAMSCFVPGLGRYGLNTATLAAGTWTLNGNTSQWQTLSSSGFVDSNAGEIRIVSFGCIFRSTASATNCQGLVNTFVVPNPINGMTLGALSSNYPETRMMPMTAGMELSWISKPVGTKAHMFRAYSDATSTMTDFDWTSMFVEISGGAVSTAVAVVEYVVNVEFTLKNASIGASNMAGTITKPRPANPVANTIQSSVHSKMDSFVSGGVEKLEKAVSTAASDAFDMLGSFGLGLLGF